jgi:hypothetical protein
MSSHCNIVIPEEIFVIDGFDASIGIVAIHGFCLSDASANVEPISIFGVGECPYLEISGIDFLS